MYTFLDNYMRFGKKGFNNIAFPRRIHKANIVRLKDYYNRYPNKVNNSNIFARMLDFAPINIDDSIYDILDQIPRATSLIKHTFPVITNFKKDIVWQRKFIGGFAQVLTKDYKNNFTYKITEELITNDFRKIEPLKVIYHNGYNNSYRHPSNFRNTETILYLDIELMLVQYKLWRDNQLLKNGVYTSDYYVYNVLLADIIPEFIDLTVLNCILNNNDKLKFTKQPAYIEDISSHILKYVKEYKKKKYYLSNYEGGAVAQMPVIHNEVMSDIFKLDTDISFHNYILYIYAIFPVIEFVLREDKNFINKGLFSSEFLYNDMFTNTSELKGFCH